MCLEKSPSAIASQTCTASPIAPSNESNIRLNILAVMAISSSPTILERVLKSNRFDTSLIDLLMMAKSLTILLATARPIANKAINKITPNTTSKIEIHIKVFALSFT